MVWEAVADESDEPVVEEWADLVQHLPVLWRAAGVRADPVAVALRAGRP